MRRTRPHPCSAHAEGCVTSSPTWVASTVQARMVRDGLVQLLRAVVDRITPCVGDVKDFVKFCLTGGGTDRVDSLDSTLGGAVGGAARRPMAQTIATSSPVGRCGRLAMVTAEDTARRPTDWSALYACSLVNRPSGRSEDQAQ